MIDIYYVIIPSIIAPLVVAAYTFLLVESTKLISFLLISSFSFLAFLITLKLIPIFKLFNLKADLWGHDINKKGTELGEKKMYLFLPIISKNYFFPFTDQKLWGQFQPQCLCYLICSAFYTANIMRNRCFLNILLPFCLFVSLYFQCVFISIYFFSN